MDYLAVGEGALAVVGGAAILKGVAQRFKAVRPAIGQVYIRGRIGEYSAAYAPSRGVTRKGVEELIDAALEDGMKGFVFDIDSPGGQVVPSKAIAERIEGLDVPAVALVRGCAASGAYWIASACDKVVADDLSMIGSIGVILPHVEISGLAQRVGVRYDGIKAGEFKDMGSPFRPFTERERKLLTEDLGKVHDAFQQAVAKNRSLSAEEVAAVSQGLMYSGRRALQLKLVDEIGGMDRAKALVEEAAGVTGCEVTEYKPKKGLLEKLFSRREEAYGAGQAFVSGALEQLRAEGALRLE